MAGATQYVSQLVAPYEPTVPLDDLVVQLNRLYHSVEASHYDNWHAEILVQLPPVWQEMLRQAALLEPEKWTILDFGCGTGFEAEQLIEALPADRIENLTCYDLSPEMLSQCREKIGSRCGRAVFTSNLDDLRRGQRRFNVLMTNALLHHVVRPWQMIESLFPLLEPHALWLQGHEPSRRFLENAECLAAHEAFLREHRWRRFLSPKKYLGRLNRLLRRDHDPAATAASRSYREGLFRRKPPAQVVGWLVDYHVAHNGEQARAGKGFNVEELKEDLRAQWQLQWTTTYSFMGPLGEHLLPPHWLQRAVALRKKYPQDGGSFSCIWRRA
jgi:2-polyprenyl-3-methyl-5-hydroxy-6-metoxy-1,4-benzoquinol methylase